MRRFVIALGALVLLATACSSTEEQFKDSLVDQGFTEEQAQCTVDRLEAAGIDPEDVTDEALGDNDPPPEAIAATIECLTDGELSDELLEGITETDPADLTEEGVGDPALDALYSACEGGDGQACDDLYFQSAFGSRYEDFGNTCGNRFDFSPGLCADQDLS